MDFGDPYPGKPAPLRPALVIGPAEAFGPTFPFVIVTPLTTTHRALSLHVEVGATPMTGLDETSYIQCELIRSVSRNRLVHRLGAIESDVSHEVVTVIKTLLGY
ncbi:MAG TPA: type II toxin-antitoxin system PemK/MazF family toxin [Acidimicrobiia bacterium]|nr:type II toxin-antitoxin system PemK/MazF family toxin [Acidimicrobiia bacterium]